MRNIKLCFLTHTAGSQANHIGSAQGWYMFDTDLILLSGYKGCLIWILLNINVSLAAVLLTTFTLYASYVDINESNKSLF